MVCHWDQQRFKATIPIDPGHTNVGTIYTASGVDQALTAIDSVWESAKEFAMDSIVRIPEIAPERYPP
jgi:hypothetical protein